MRIGEALKLIKINLKENWGIYFNTVFFYFLFFYSREESHVQRITQLNEYYLTDSFFSFSSDETLSITYVLFMISFFFFDIFFFDDKDRVIKGAKSLSYAIIVGLLYALVIQRVLTSIGMQLNRITAIEEVIQDFEVTAIDHYVELKSQKDYIMSKDKFQKEDLSNLKVNDTIHIVFKKGILGVKYMEGGKIRMKQ